MKLTTLLLLLISYPLSGLYLLIYCCSKSDRRHFENCELCECWRRSAYS